MEKSSSTRKQGVEELRRQWKAIKYRDLCDDRWPALPPATDADANVEFFSSKLVPALQV
jgi:hypothetical protein